MIFKECEMLTVVPTKIVGPIKMNYNKGAELISVPLATFEIPLWNSTKRGALISQKTAGINVHVIEDLMSRSVIVEANDLKSALECKMWIENHNADIGKAIKNTGNFVDLKRIDIENIGKLLYIRLSVTTGNAAGHNMVTKAADAVLNLIISKCKNVKYISISGNYCADKKVSSVNGILGRGKRVSAEIIVPYDICNTILNTNPSKIVELNMKKNLIGSILSGGVRSANAHFANIILALYLSTGQDAANIVEASQGITFADLQGDSLYFSVDIPNIIVGTVGNGKNLDFALNNLEMLGCQSSKQDSAKRLSAIIASTVLCAELSLLAAQTNQGELIRSHMALERYKI